MLHIMHTTGATGAAFLVALDMDEKDNRGNALGLLAWFDMRYPDHVGRKYPKVRGLDVAGQFVASYYVSSFMDGWDPDRREVTLALWGDEPSWSIAPNEIRAVRTWVTDCYRREGREVPADVWDVPNLRTAGK